jgi:hypothetical protein
MNEREASGDDANWSALRQLFAMKAGRVLSAREAGDAAGVEQDSFLRVAPWRARAERPKSLLQFAHF